MKQNLTTTFLTAVGMLSWGMATAYALPHTTAPEAAAQQNNACTGVVKEASGEAVIGASVLVKGTANGTITDMDGRFSLAGVRRGSTLVISYIGFQTQEVVWNGNSLDVLLKEDAKALEEVVVVGYGTQKKANLSGSVAQISAKELATRPVQNVSSALQGLMAGVTVTAGTGAPGLDGSTIRVRGVGTLNSANPYILVDGVETGTLNALEPTDIESISVLKDAASAAIYGSKASNGVILITTKRGKDGKPRVTYNGNVGFQTATRLVDRLSSADYATLLNQAQVAAGRTARFSDAEIQKFRDGSDPDNYPNTDWYDEAYKTGVQHSHSVNVSGGMEAVKYMASAGYMHQTGILPNSVRTRFTGRTNLDIKLSKRVEAHMGLAFIGNNYDDPTNSYVGGGSDQIVRQLNIIAPWIKGRFSDGTYGTISDGNPLAWLDSGEVIRRENKNFTGTLGVDFTIVDGLILTARGAYVSDNQNYKDFQKYIRYNANKATGPNQLTEARYEWERKTFDLLLNYDKTFGAHNVKGLAGWHTEEYDYRQLTAYRKNFPNNDLTDLNAGDTSTSTNGGYSRELNMVSWFGRVNYSFLDRYLFEANLRADASSRFAKGHRWGYFPSFSAAWRISEENFMESTKGWLDNLKIRASWGQLGNQDALNDFYPTLNTYRLGRTYAFDGALVSGYDQNNYKINTISWEKARTVGVGLDFAVLGNKLSGSIDYYDRKTTGIIMSVAVPYEFALNPYVDNVGAMSNRGLELALNYQDKIGDFQFGVSANFAYNKNKILDLGGETFMADPNNGNMRRQVGKAINSYYMYSTGGLFQSDAEAQEWMNKYQGQAGYPFGTRQFKGGDIIYLDTNNDGKITADDREFKNSTNPAYTFGLTLNAAWKNFDFQAMFSGYAKASRIINQEVYGDFRGDNSHPATVWLDAWSETNKGGSMPRISAQGTSPSEPQVVMSDFWLQNTSHLRLKNLQIGYTLPKSVVQSMGLNSVRFYYSAENLFTIDGLKVNADPEVSSERGSSYPLIMTNSFGVNVTF